MAKFGLIGHFPILELLLMRGPMVLIKIGDRQIELRQAKRIHGKFFITPEGVFELDGDYNLNFNGTQIYLYNLSNPKPISLRNVEKLQNLYKQKRVDQITMELSRIKKALTLGENKLRESLDALTDVYGDKEKFLNDDDVKWLIDWKTYNKESIKLLNLKKVSQHRLDRDISPKVPTIFPSLIFFTVGMGVVVAMSQLNPFYLIPQIMEKIGGIFG